MRRNVMFRIRIDFGRQFVELLTFLKFKVVLPVVLGRSIHAMRFDSNMIGHYLRVLKGRLNRFWISFSMRQLVYDGVRTVYDGITTIPGPTACMPVVQGKSRYYYVPWDKKSDRYILQEDCGVFRYRHGSLMP